MLEQHGSIRSSQLARHVERVETCHEPSGIWAFIETAQFDHNNNSLIRHNPRIAVSIKLLWSVQQTMSEYLPKLQRQPRVGHGLDAPKDWIRSRFSGKFMDWIGLVG